MYEPSMIAELQALYLGHAHKGRVNLHRNLGQWCKILTLEHTVKISCDLINSKTGTRHKNNRHKT